MTGLNLASKSLSGTIPAQVGHLFAMTTLNLSSNQLTGAIPAELGWLVNLTEVRLSGNTLTGCIPLTLKSVATNDLSSLNLPYCEPPPPANLRAGTPGEASLSLLWDAVANAGTYQVEVWVPDGRTWRSDTDALTGTTAHGGGAAVRDGVRRAGAGVWQRDGLCGGLGRAVGAVDGDDGGLHAAGVRPWAPRVHGQ